MSNFQISPRVDWSELPEDVIKIILEFYYDSQREYWSQITKQRIFTYPQLIFTQQEKRMVEYHLNKSHMIGLIPKTKNFAPYVDMISEHINFHSNRKKLIIYDKKKGAYKSKKPQRCSLCGRLGHNKNNRNWH